MSKIFYYNGILLPELPRWDKEKYPFGAIWKKEDKEKYFFIASSTEYTVQSDGTKIFESYPEVYYEAVDYDWEASFNPYTYKVVWSNYKVYKDSGSLYLSPSEPVDYIPYYLYNGFPAPVLPENIKYYSHYLLAVKPKYNGEFCAQIITFYDENLPTYDPSTGVVNSSIRAAFYYPSGDDSFWIHPWRRDNSPDPEEYSVNKDNLVWTNTTIEGLMEASEPVPFEYTTTDPFGMTRHTAFSIGQIMGQRIREQRNGREHIAYLYNGVRLPKLPEWDREAYPYAAITYKKHVDGSWGATLFASVTKYTATSTGLYSGSLSIGNIEFSVDNKTESWEAKSGVYTYPIIWANYDVYYSDIAEDVGGTLYLAASDPIPVYE